MMDSFLAIAVICATLGWGISRRRAHADEHRIEELLDELARLKQAQAWSYARWDELEARFRRLHEVISPGQPFASCWQVCRDVERLVERSRAWSQESRN